ncbi:MAG: HAD family hydrolase [Anaerolineae bacterium]|nr:HAD family hydrolase [Anaerolineae bacterium]
MGPRPARAAVLLDRDGTIVRHVPYLSRPDQLELLPGAASGLRTLREAGFALVLVTNQAGVAHGYFTEEDVRRVHARLQHLLAEQGAPLDAIYYCPHHPQGQGAYRRDCACRKPGTALLERAAHDLGLDLSRSVVVGDRETDVIAGARLGCRTVLVRTGYGQSMLDAGLVDGVLDYAADDLPAAAAWIVRSVGGGAFRVPEPGARAGQEREGERG